jgi:hypothetical protein
MAERVQYSVSGGGVRVLIWQLPSEFLSGGAGRRAAVRYSGACKHAGSHEQTTPRCLRVVALVLNSCEHVNRVHKLKVRARVTRDTRQ